MIPCDAKSWWRVGALGRAPSRGNAPPVRDHLTFGDASFLFAASHTHFAPAVDPSKPLLGRAQPAYVNWVAERGAALLRRLAAAEPMPRGLVEYRSGPAAHAINRRR